MDVFESSKLVGGDEPIFDWVELVESYCTVFISGFVICSGGT